MKNLPRTILFIFLISMLLIPLGLVSAQGGLPESPLKDQSWVRLGGPPGGVGYDIRRNPDDPNIMYVTDSSAGIHKSTDRGQSWELINEGIDLTTGTSGDSIPIFTVRIDPNDPEIVWVGMQNLSGIYRSENGGATWEKRSNGIEESFGLTFRGFAIEPGNSDVVYAAAEISSSWWSDVFRPGSGFGMTKGVVYKSTDAGLNWNPIWRGDNLARYVLIDPEDVNTLYISTGIFDRDAANSDWETFTPGGVGVQKSTNGGQTWREINNGLGNLYVNSLDFHPENSQIIIAGTKHVLHEYNAGGGVYITYDGGEEWHYLVGTESSAVEFADNFPEYIYSVGQHEFHRSADGGETWEHIPGLWGPSNMISGIAMDIDVDPDDPLTFFVNSYQGGNFYTEDGGDSWVPASVGYSGAMTRDIDVHPTNPAVVYLSGRTGPFYSVNGGYSWVGIKHPDDNAEGDEIGIDPTNPLHILNGDGDHGCIMESFDLGLNWEYRICHDQELRDLSSRVTNELMRHQGVQAFAYAPSNPDRIYAGFGVQKCGENHDDYHCNGYSLKPILISNDGGNSWTSPDIQLLFGKTINEIVVNPNDQDHAWATTDGLGVIQTYDGGLNWEITSAGMGSEFVTTLAVDPTNPDQLYAGVMNGAIYVSQDGGATWIQSATGMDFNEAIRSIVVDPLRTNVVYAGSWRTGVYLSEDYGKTWQQINDGLSFRAILDLGVSQDGSTLYAATQGGGVFRLSSFSQEDLDIRGSEFEVPVPSDQDAPSQPAADSSAGQIVLPEWDESYLLEEDPVGDLYEEGMDLTAGYGARDDEYLYFEIGLADPAAEIVQFDIILEINGVELMISHSPGSSEGYANDFNNIGLEGPTKDTYFHFGETYQGQISLAFLGYPERVNLRKVNAMVGDGNSSWGASDDWHTRKDTPYLTPSSSGDELLSEVQLPDWDERYLIDTDPVGDLERDGLDFTNIYAAKDDTYLYFEVEFVDPSADVVQFDILLTINGVDTMINHTAADTKGYINDPELGEADGSLSDALFMFGETYQVQIALASLGNPDQVKLRSVGAAVGVCCDDWGVSDSWYTDKDTPYYEWPEAEGPADEQLAEESLPAENDSDAFYLPFLIAGGVIILLGGGWVVIKQRTAGGANEDG